MTERDSMNTVLERIASPYRARPGEYGMPAFYTVFMHLLDRIEALEARVTTLESRPTGGMAVPMVFR